MISLIEGELIAENHGLNFIYFVSIIKIKQRSGSKVQFICFWKSSASFLLKEAEKCAFLKRTHDAFIVHNNYCHEQVRFEFLKKSLYSTEVSL